MGSFSSIDEIRNHEGDIDNIIKEVIDIDDDDSKIASLILDICSVNTLVEDEDILYDFYRETEDRKAKFELSKCFLKIVESGHVSEKLMQLTLDMTEPSYHTTEMNEIAFKRILWCVEWRNYLNTSLRREFDIEDCNSNKSSIKKQYNITSNGEKIGTILKYKYRNRSKIDIQRLEKLRVISSTYDEGIIRNGLKIWIEILQNDIVSEIPSSIVKDACHLVSKFAQQSFTRLSLNIMKLSYTIVDTELQRHIIHSLCDPSEEISQLATDTLIDIVVQQKGDISKEDHVIEIIRREYGISKGKSIEMTMMRRPNFKTACVALSYLLSESNVSHFLAKIGLLKFSVKTP